VINNSIYKVYISPGKISFDDLTISTPELVFSRDGTINQLIAKNGSGKTSFINALYGIIPDIISATQTIRCSITLNDKSVVVNPFDKSVLRILPQQPKHLLYGLLPIDEVKLCKSYCKEWTQLLLDYLNIDELNPISSFNLSDGEQKRLCFFKILNSFPKLIITDEWNTHLDPFWINRINEILEIYHAKGGYYIHFLSRETIGKIKTLNFVTELNPRPAYKDEKISIDNIPSIKLCFKSINESFSVKYHSYDKKKIQSINIQDSQFISIIGKNGAGKSTFLVNLWYRLKKKLKKNAVILIPAEPYYHILGPQVKDQIARVLREDTLNLTEFIRKIILKDDDDDVFTLSSGQIKMFAIVLSLFSKAQVILIDEPFAALDENNEKIIEALLIYFSHLGKTIIITEHSPRLKIPTNIVHL